MKNSKPDAYSRKYAGRPDDVIKCDLCGFRAVKMQFDDEGICPSCKAKCFITDGHNKKGGK